MSAPQHDNLVQDGVPPTEAERRERWLAARRTAITATDAGAILGVSPYATPLDIYRDKRGELPDQDLSDSPWLEAGVRMQRPIIDWWASRKNVQVVHADPYHFTKSLKTPLIGASLDAQVATTSHPVDAKNIGWRTGEWGDDETDQIPLQYAVQLGVQMYVTDTDTAHLPVLFGGRELSHFIVHRDPELEASVVAHCLAFWRDHVEAGALPEIDGSKSFTNHLMKMFEKVTEQVIEATPEHDQIAAKLAVEKARFDEIEMEVDRLKNVLRAVIGERRAVQGKHWKATWSRTKDTQQTDFEAITRLYEEKLKFLAALFVNPDRLGLYVGDGGVALSADIHAWIHNATLKNTITKAGHRRLTFTYKDPA